MLYGLFLGCRHEIGEVVLGPEKRKVRTMTHNVASYLERSVQSYLALLPQRSQLKKAATPLLTSSVGPDRCALVSVGPSLSCPWCKVRFPESEFVRGGTRTQKAMQSEGSGKTGTSSNIAVTPPPRGALADKAASILMQVLFVARYARFDLF